MIIKLFILGVIEKLDAVVLEDMLVNGVWNDVLSFDNINDSVECFYYCFARFVRCIVTPAPH